MIQLDSVSKIYGKKDAAFTALDSVSLTIPNKSVVAIIGKSGSGKSTLMHVMSGLDPVSSGVVKVAGHDIASMKTKEVDRFRATTIGFIFQSFFVEPKQTCYQNISLPLEIKGVPKSQRRARIEEALKSVDLLDKMNSPAANLSGGQKQRLAIARAIVNKPAYIFADEPTGNLDSANGAKIMKLLFGLNKSLGSTLAIVTHDPDIAAQCEYTIRLHDGKIAENTIELGNTAKSKSTHKRSRRAKKVA